MLEPIHGTAVEISVRLTFTRQVTFNIGLITFKTMDWIIFLSATTTGAPGNWKLSQSVTKTLREWRQTGRTDEFDLNKTSVGQCSLDKTTGFYRLLVGIGVASVDNDTGNRTAGRSTALRPSTGGRWRPSELGNTRNGRVAQIMNYNNSNTADTK